MIVVSCFSSSGNADTDTRGKGLSSFPLNCVWGNFVDGLERQRGKDGEEWGEWEEITSKSAPD